MHAVLAIIADGGWAIVVIEREGRNKLISHLIYIFVLNPSMSALSNPFRVGSRGWGMFIHGNHDARGENGSLWWECLCDVCFAGEKSSEREFFIPAVKNHRGLRTTQWQNDSAHQDACLCAVVVSWKLTQPFIWMKNELEAWYDT